LSLFHGEIEEVIRDDFVHLAMHAGIGLQLGRLSGTPRNAVNVAENHELCAQRTVKGSRCPRGVNWANSNFLAIIKPYT
jgi:hypothetical protein